MYLSPATDSKFIKASTSGSSGGSRPPPWRMRAGRYKKNRDRERNPSVCSDSETESSTIHVTSDDLCLTVPKKWSLPLPMVSRGSESDSTSSSWSARSADENTEDERSPIPSPSASTHSNEGSNVSVDASADEKISRKCKRPKKISKAAETHKFTRMKTTNYGRCKICDAYVYFWGYQCKECELIIHKKCLKKMTIMCAKAPLPPKESILGLDLASLEEEVPVLVKICASEIERRSVSKPGIYRMTGVSTRVENILKSFESGPHLIDVSDVSPNDLTSVLKEFLRELKYPLITNDVYKEFIAIGRIYRHNEPTKTHELIEGLREAVKKLNKNHKSTLSYLMHHLKRITNHHEENSMTPNSMGIIFAPTLFRPREAINDLYTEVFEAAPQARVIELMILHANDVFGPSPQASSTFTFS